MKSVLFKTENLGKTYRDFKAVNQVNLTIESGDVYGFVGPNGAGKSTVIKMMTGLIEPTEGRVYKNAKEIGAVIETPAFYNHLTGYENLKILAIQYGSFAMERIDTVLEMVELKEAAHKKVGQYSLGMKQRLGIARAFLNDPEIIILDEPTNGLDPYGIKSIRKLIIKLAKFYGKTFFISSHILSELELVCTKVGIIHRGHLLEEVKMEVLKERIGAGTFEDYFLEKTKEDRAYV